MGQSPPAPAPVPVRPTSQSLLPAQEKVSAYRRKLMHQEAECSGAGKKCWYLGPAAAHMKCPFTVACWGWCSLKSCWANSRYCKLKICFVVFALLKSSKFHSLKDYI